MFLNTKITKAVAWALGTGLCFMFLMFVGVAVVGKNRAQSDSWVLWLGVTVSFMVLAAGLVGDWLGKH